MNSLILNQIFNSEVVPDFFGYGMSNKVKYDRFPYINPSVSPLSELEKESIRIDMSQLFFNVDKLGPFELEILSYLYPKKQHIINNLIGSRGSGKTAIVYYIFKFLQNNIRFNEPFNRPIILYVDINNIPTNRHFTNSGQIPEILKIAAVSVFHQLHINYFEELLHFVQMYSKKNHNVYYVDRFLRQLRINIASLTSMSARDFLFDCFDNYTNNNEPYTTFNLALNLVGEIVKLNKNGFVFCCIDNIDPLPPMMQNDINQSVLALVNEARIPIIMPMRIISARNDNIYQYQSNFVPHSSLSPKREITRRLHHTFRVFFDNTEDNIFLRNLSDYEKTAFALITAEIFNAFQNSAELMELFHSIVGYSHKRGLSFMKRCYLENDKFLNFSSLINEEIILNVRLIIQNNIYDFDKMMKSLYSVCYRLYLNFNKDIPKPYFFLQLIMNNCLKKTNESGPILENLYLNPCEQDRKTSNILLRILMFLHERYMNSNSKPPQIKDIIRLCKCYLYEEDMIYTTINILHRPESRLLFNTGKNQYDSFEDLYQSKNEEIGVSHIGIQYVSKLAKSLDYIGLMLVKKEPEKKTLLEDNLVNRITYILRLMFDSLNEEMDWGYYITQNIQPCVCDSKNLLLFANYWTEPIERCLKILKTHLTNLSKITDNDNALRHYKEEVDKAFDSYEGYRTGFYNKGILKCPDCILLLQNYWASILIKETNEGKIIIPN